MGHQTQNNTILLFCDILTTELACKMSYNVEKYGRNFQMVGLSKLQNSNSVKSWASEAILKLKYSVDWLIKFRQVQVHTKNIVYHFSSIPLSLRMR